MKDLEKLGISQRQYDLRMAICKFYHIDDKDFFDKKLYLVDEKVLFARIAASHNHIDLNLLSASSEDYEKITGLKDNLIIELFPLYGFSEEYFLNYLSYFKTTSENDDEENENE